MKVSKGHSPSPKGDQYRAPGLCHAGIFFWLNIICIESAGTFCECSIRIILITLYAVLSRSCSLCGCGRPPQTKSLIIEVALDAAVMCSLLVPCCLIYSFREFSETEEWNILPIKTLLGNVDLRRYIVIVNGHGCTAANIDSYGADNCDDSCIGSCIYPPKKIMDNLNTTARGV